MEQLGIDPLQLGTQILNFVVMVVVLTYFLYKPILRTLKERREKIAQGLAYEEKTKAEFQKTESKRAAVVAAAKEEGVRIVEEAKKSGKLVEADIIAKAHEEARAIVEKGKTDVEMERMNMEKNLRDRIVAVAEAIATKALETALSAKVQKSIIDNKIRTLGKELS